MSRTAALAVAVGTPLVISAVLGAAGGLLANTTAALVLVLVVVGAACLGHRSAGLAAAVSAGLGFDFFLTAPYLTFSVTDPGDVETLVALTLVAVAVTEIVQWGRRYRSQLGDREAYLDALLAISPQHGRGDRWIDAVGDYLVALLDLDACSWVDVVDPYAPRLDRDGQVRNRGRVLPVDDDGLPVLSTLVLPVRPDEPGSPGFVLTASTHVARPTPRQRRLAAALADQTGWALQQRQA
jgi:hypothetical protein